MNIFSTWYLLSFTATGRPWGQYWISPDWTRSTRRRSSAGSVYIPALMADLQAMLDSRLSRAASGSARFSRRSSASSSRAPAGSSISPGTSRTSTAPPKSSHRKPYRSSRGSCSSTAAQSSGGSSTANGSSRVWVITGSAAAFSASNRTRSWAACLSMSHTFSPSSSQMI